MNVIAFPKKYQIYEIEFPKIEGVSVLIKPISSSDYENLHNMIMSPRRRKGQFLKIFSSIVIRGWKGLKRKHLPILLENVESIENPDNEIMFSEQKALELMKNSEEFCTFIMERYNKENWLV